MAIRSLSTIIADAIAFLTSKRPNIATFTGTVVRDVVVEAPAQEFDQIYSELEHTQQLQSLLYADNMTQAELDAFANTYNMTRLGGTQATGIVTFRVRNFSFTSSAIAVPVGAVVATIGTTTLPQVTFVTTSPITFNPAIAPTYFNPATGFYEQSVTIVAQNIGISGNVASNTITRLATSVLNIDSITNYGVTSGGTDIESNSAFASRIRLKLAGNSIGTESGILSLVRTNSNVQDALVVGPNDFEMLRSQFGGEVDVYIRGTRLVTIFDTPLYELTGSQEFILQHQPVESVPVVTGIVSSVPYTFVEGVDFDYVEDVSVLFKGSTRATSKIVFLGSGALPDDATIITITYTYDALMEDLQSLLNQANNNIITSDILVRKANIAEIDVEADITIFSGFVGATVATAVQTAVSQFINTLAMGVSINRSDLIAVIEEVDGVNSVDLDTLELFKNGVLIPQTQQRITIFKTEYPVSDVITINVI